MGQARGGGGGEERKATPPGLPASQKLQPETPNSNPKLQKTPTQNSKQILSLKQEITRGVVMRLTKFAMASALDAWGAAAVAAREARQRRLVYPHSKNSHPKPQT